MYYDSLPRFVRHALINHYHDSFVNVIISKPQAKTSWPSSTTYRSCGNDLRGWHSTFAAVAVVTVDLCRSCGRKASSDVFFPEKLIRAISCNANGIPLGHQLFRIAMEALGGLVSSAVAAMMFQRASTDVCTCVHATHAMLDGLQANMGQWYHRFIFNP